MGHLIVTGILTLVTETSWGQYFYLGNTHDYNNHPLRRKPLLEGKSVLKDYRGGGASLEGDNLVVLYYLSASEIWPDKWVVFSGSGFIREGLLYFKNEI